MNQTNRAVVESYLAMVKEAQGAPSRIDAQRIILPWMLENAPFICTEEGQQLSPLEQQKEMARFAKLLADLLIKPASAP